MEIPQEILDAWDSETLSQVTEALRVLPEDLHPAVFYLGGLIENTRHSMVPFLLKEEPDFSGIYANFGIDADEVHEASVDLYLELPKIFDEFVALLNALIRGEYISVWMFFNERLQFFTISTSAVAATSDDMAEADSFLERKNKELFLLRDTVATLSRYMSGAATPPH